MLTPLQTDAAQRRHELFSWAISLETVICFLFPGLFLVVGTMTLPMVLARILRGDADAWAWQFMATFVAAWWGLVAVVRVAFLLCTRQGRDQRARWTLLGLGCGVSLALFMAYSAWTHKAHREPLSLAFVYMPLACTAHLVYLARHALFTRATADS